MTDQSEPDIPVEIDETAVEPETITNVVEEQDDVWVASDQTPVAQEDTGLTLEDEPDDDTDDPVETVTELLIELPDPDYSPLYQSNAADGAQ